MPPAFDPYSYSSTSAALAGFAPSPPPLPNYDEWMHTLACVMDGNWSVDTPSYSHSYHACYSIILHCTVVPSARIALRMLDRYCHTKATTQYSHSGGWLTLSRA